MANDLVGSHRAGPSERPGPGGPCEGHGEEDHGEEGLCESEEGPTSSPLSVTETEQHSEHSPEAQQVSHFTF